MKNYRSIIGDAADMVSKVLKNDWAGAGTTYGDILINTIGPVPASADKLYLYWILTKILKKIFSVKNTDSKTLIKYNIRI